MKNVKKLIQGGNLVTELLSTAKAYSETLEFKDGQLVAWRDEYSDITNAMTCGIGVFLGWLPPDQRRFELQDNCPAADYIDCRVISFYDSKANLPKTGVAALPSARLRPITEEEANAIVSSLMAAKAKSDLGALEKFMTTSGNNIKLRPNIKLGDICIDDDGDHLICLEEPTEARGAWSILTACIIDNEVKTGNRDCKGITVVADAAVRAAGFDPDVFRHLVTSGNTKGTSVN